VTWNRAPVAAALVNVIGTATAGAVTVFAEPPQTLNPPAVTVGGSTMLFATAAFAADEVDLSLVCVAAVGHYNDLDGLVQQVRGAVTGNPTLAGAVKSAWPYEQRNNRNVNVAGVDLSTVELVVKVVM
jgi:hypothetical protein